jgi:hypothetical protein
LVQISTSNFVLRLKDITFGNTDYGRGGQISDEVIIRFAKSAPQLEKATSESATKLTKPPLLALTEHCAHIKTVRITDYDKCRCGIEGYSFNPFATKETLAPNLQKLSLVDQL